MALQAEGVPVIRAEDYTVVDSQVMLNHPRVQMLADTLDYNGRRRPYLYLVSPSEGVNVVALTREAQIVLTRQYRHPVREVILDLPGGRVEPDEDPARAARRELEEETGYRAGRLVFLCRYNQFPGSIRAATSLFFAADLAFTRQNLEENEELEVVLMPAADLLGRITSGELYDGSLQLGVLLAKHKGLLGGG